MGRFDEFYTAIDDINDCIKKDLFGVSSENEILDSVEPLSTYVTGILYPKKPTQTYDDSSQLTFFEEEFDSDNEIDLEDKFKVDDDSINSANKYKPSSMGISVMVSASCKQLSIVFECGTYMHFETDKNASDGTKIKSHCYQRVPYKYYSKANVPDKLGTVSERLEVKVSDDVILPIDINITVRKIMDDRSKIITISVVNNAIEINKLHTRNEYALFQCSLTIGSDLAFLPIYHNSFSNNDIESQIMAMIYCSIKNYAYGHGCSVAYDETKSEIFEIRSEYIPIEQVLQMLPGTISEDDILLLDNWKNANRDTTCNKLCKFIDEYELWKEKSLADFKYKNTYAKAVNELIKRIEVCIRRLRHGVEILRNSDDSWKAFILMNEAMLLQRINTKKQNKNSIKWYPFQLAYILQIIPDIAIPENEYRNTVDLLWFPTGGGKTEAYLGVAAFTIFYRRISSNSINDGVTVIMRYTLRLLTIQQFERAAALICACEYLRKTNNIPGGEINIGLWIGSSMTPNHIDAVSEVLVKLKENKDEKIYEGNPIQITKCPWCGKEIDITGYNIKNGNLHICCNDNPDCEFHKGLPIYVVDDDIYAKKPTLILSTIDKFARIAWVEESKNLFGGSYNMPPSLVIQDELHLISGSLGSLSGLYEIAVDYLCNRNGILPKVIASTATVKNADQQVKSLYGKEMIQFPPNGLSYTDSFFAHIADKNERPARIYVGVCENGGSIKDLMVRIYAVLTLIKAKFTKENLSDDVIDQYYTIVGYFNAIRDLGATSNVLQDRMYTQTRTLLAHKFKDICDELGIDSTDIPRFNSEELTSRKSSKEIKETLECLEIKYNESGCYSYILASNMLSVGIDINRLGLMTVYNQPKTNSEYIQATSRVGRQNPGLVIAMYNPMRSRDKSHYEQFGFYHKSFYQYVEATSITPFSSKAMEKALHCVFIAMVRLSITDFGGNENAVYFNGKHNNVKRIKTFILDRINYIHPKAYDYAEELIDDLISAWEKMTEVYSDLCYVGRNSESISLLNSSESDYDFDFPPVLNSLRNVEESSNIYLYR